MIHIVGGSGFIGTRLANRLAAAEKSFCIVDKSVSKAFPALTRQADVRDAEALTRALGDGVIINLAAEHRDDVSPRSLYHDVNVVGARNVCTAAEANGISTIVFTSSVAVYGFAPRGTDETGTFNPFNDYGRTKLDAESVYKEWQSRDPANRTLVIVRPTVVFGERNRGNVYNLLRQVASGKFVMIGSGCNVKSMAYVENIVAFLEHTLGFSRGVHIYNYVDKPDFDMNTLVETVYSTLGMKGSSIRLPYSIGLVAGTCFDLAARITGKKFPVSAIRVKKFCSDTMFSTSIATTGFSPPFDLSTALVRTVQFEFVDARLDSDVFYSE